MEWIPKLIDNLDSTAFALYQSWGGYYRWVLLRLALTIIAVSAMVFSPALRVTAIAVVVTYLAMQTLDGLISRIRASRAVRAQG